MVPEPKIPASLAIEKLMLSIAGSRAGINQGPISAEAKAAHGRFLDAFGEAAKRLYQEAPDAGAAQAIFIAEVAAYTLGRIIGSAHMGEFEEETATGLLDKLGRSVVAGWRVSMAESAEMMGGTKQ